MDRRPYKLLARYLGVAISLVALAYFVHFLVANSSGIDFGRFGISSLAALSAATAIYAVTHVINALSWVQLIKSLGAYLSWKHAFSILFVSQFAKYVPGNVAALIGRVVLAQRHGIRPAIVVASLVFETGWVVVAAAAVALIAVVEIGPDMAGGASLPEAAQLLTGAVVFVLAPFAGLLLVHVSNKLSGYLLYDNEMRSPGVGTLIVCLGIYAMSFFLVGGLIQILAIHFYPESHVSIATLSGIYSLAWVVGYLTPGAPAGLGPRDAVFVILAASVFDAEAAAFLALAVRMVTAVGDAIVFGVGVLLQNLMDRWS